FIALRLRPGVGTRAMQPVRVRTPGASPTLPLRMVTAGIGAKVGLTLYLVSEGRYHTQNFPAPVMNYHDLAWDQAKSHTNYRDLVDRAITDSKGEGWLTEYAMRGEIANLDRLYNTACTRLPYERVSCGGGNDLPWDGGLADAHASDADVQTDA